MNVLFDKFKEVLLAVAPITTIVLVLNFTLTPLGMPVLLRFLAGALLITVGLSIFLFGIDIAITPIGSLMGSQLTKSNKLWVIVVSGIMLGFFITIAEPDLHILAEQVSIVTSGDISKFSIVAVVSIGVAVMLSAGMVRILYNIPLYRMLTVAYLAIFGLAAFASEEFLAISFDSSGATTGALTVPFILALALGVSSMKKDSKASEKDSFGLVAVASTGAIISVMLMNVFFKSDKLKGSIDVAASHADSLFAPFAAQLPRVSLDVLMALSPLIAVFVIFQVISFKLHKRQFVRIIKGILYSFIGLVLFLTGVGAGFMDVGVITGYHLASMENKAFIIVVGFAVGLVTILAEPAVHVLTHQVEDVTSGFVKRKIILAALSVGVGAAVALSVIRVLTPALHLWHYLLPGYAIAIAMMYFTPKLFVGIAFDSGGVASGPMTATFILAFTEGAAESIPGASVLVDGFGVIAMVALTPLITIQALGLLYKLKTRKEGVGFFES
ncbi:MAG: DUF1538 domain-containing protein [Clostridiales bacterium]|nr:DUF1538 domain-containing protein [Clostridiales bacterium]